MSNIEEPRKSSLVRRECEMHTGINNNSKYISALDQSLDKSKKRGTKPVLKSGFKQVYHNSYEKFLSNINESDIKHMNTMNINGKNFHLFETLNNESQEVQVEERIRQARERTAEQNILEHIKEESSQQNTVRNTLNSQPSRNNFSFRNNNFRFDTSKNKSRQKEFFTSKNDANRMHFFRNSEKHIYHLEHKMNTNPEFLKKLQFADKESFGRKGFYDEHGAEARRQSLNVTNNEITNNNQNVQISNKMNTYIFIVNDKKKGPLDEPRASQEEARPRKPSPGSTNSHARAGQDDAEERGLSRESRSKAQSSQREEAHSVRSKKIVVATRENNEETFENTRKMESADVQLQPLNHSNHVILNTVGSVLGADWGPLGAGAGIKLIEPGPGWLLNVVIEKEKKTCKNCLQLVTPVKHREFSKGKIVLLGILFVVLFPIMIILVFFDCFLDMFATIHHLCPRCNRRLE